MTILTCDLGVPVLIRPINKLSPGKHKERIKRKHQGLSVCVSVFYMLCLTRPLFPSPFHGFTLDWNTPAIPSSFSTELSYTSINKARSPPSQKALWGTVFGRYVES